MVVYISVIEHVFVYMLCSLKSDICYSVDFSLAQGTNGGQNRMYYNIKKSYNDIVSPFDLCVQKLFKTGFLPFVGN